jgi:asparagine synthetase B (glutamine-hydrolysing)
MAKIIHLTVRNEANLPHFAAMVRKVARHIAPDNLPDPQPTVIQCAGVAVGISGPDDFVLARGTNVAAGYLVDAAGSWDKPGIDRPDGAYAVFRSNTDVVEIVTDGLASRTVWYLQTDDFFVASTSQRAIVALLGGFEFNPEVVPWMLSSGTLGPGLSWDRRIRCVPGASILSLDRRAWRLGHRTEPVAFVPVDRSGKDHEQRVLEALRRAVGAAHVADPRWAITLSGGVDSRLILSLLTDTHGLRAVTWGTQASRGDPDSDAAVAARLAAHFGLSHTYYPTDLSAASIEQVFDRFIRNGEGRVDRLSGYMDGFALWEDLVRGGVRGIVRGDEAFGKQPVRTDAEVRFMGGMQVWSDHPGLPGLAELGLPSQTMPEFAFRRPAETLETWRDRLYQQYRVPFILAALSDLKLGYVELINPLLCDSITRLIRELPDTLRTHKVLLRSIAGTLSPDLPFASVNSIEAPDQLVRSPRAAEHLRVSLTDGAADQFLPGPLIKYAVDGLRVAQPGTLRQTGRRLRRTVAGWMRRLGPSDWPSERRARGLDCNRIAFRAYVLSRTARLLRHDAEALS